MYRSLLLLWTLILLAVGGLFGLASMWEIQHKSNARSRAKDILATQLSIPKRSIQDVIANYASRLESDVASADLSDLQRCVEIARMPLIQALVVVDGSSQMIYPTSTQGKSEAQLALTAECLDLLHEFDDPRPNRPSGVPISQGPRQSPNDAIVNGSKVAQSGSGRASMPLRARTYELESASRGNLQSTDWQKSAVTEASGLADPGRRESTSTARLTNDDGSFVPKQGWITWYHRRGMVLGFLAGENNDHRSLAVVPRPRWLADLIGALPSSNAVNYKTPVGKLSVGSESTGFTFSDCQFQLIDVEGKLVYQWSASGDLDSRAFSEDRMAERPVDPPLEGWRLRIYAPEPLWIKLTGSKDRWPVWIGVLGLTGGLLCCGVFVSMNLNRHIAAARQKVSFVNQVSHELRTPLTNIRMYADLLQRDIEPGEAPEKLQVIKHESQRLGRLIENVLVFAKLDRARVDVCRSSCDVDQVIRNVVATFGPRLQDCKLEAILDLKIVEKQQVDGNVVEQLVVNLVANAEKYAATGGRIEISSSIEGTHVMIACRDYGPGIPTRHREKVFQPFFRRDDSINAPSGTGIGLAIVRELARQHGGDCVIRDANQGALFVVTLSTTDSR